VIAVPLNKSNGNKYLLYDLIYIIIFAWLFTWAYTIMPNVAFPIYLGLMISLMMHISGKLERLNKCNDIGVEERDDERQ